jgi:hypothetical protein
MGAGDTRTDGVAGANGREGGGSGVEGTMGGARDIALSSSSLADEHVVRGERGARVGFQLYWLLFWFSVLRTVR